MANPDRPSRASRVGLAGSAEPSQTATKKPVAKPAIYRAQARGR
jgi:hypothetical protein